MQRKRKLFQPRLHGPQEAPRFGFVLEAQNKSSRPGELHPQALTDPDLNVSAHPALIVQSPLDAAMANAQIAVGLLRLSC